MTKRTYDEMQNLQQAYAEDAEAELNKIADDKAAELKKMADAKAAEDAKAELKKIAEDKAVELKKTWYTRKAAKIQKIAEARASTWTSRDPATGAIWPHLRQAAELKKSADAKAAELKKDAKEKESADAKDAELKKIADDNAAEEKEIAALVEDAKAQYIKKIDDAKAAELKKKADTMYMVSAICRCQCCEDAEAELKKICNDKAAEQEDAYQKACVYESHARMHSLGKLTNCRICKERMQLSASGINICASCIPGTMTGSSTGSSKW
jgi:hypothetical protein